MGEKEWEADSVFDLLGNSLSRQILILSNHRPVSASELADHLDASNPTIYRRLNALEEHDLVEERVQPDADGNHYKTYMTCVQQITFELDSTGYNVDLELRRDTVDQFEAFWSDLEQSSPEIGSDAATNVDHDPRSTGGTDG